MRGYVKFSDRVKYYDAFEDFYRAGNPDTMINIIAGYELQRLQEYIALLTPNT